MPIKYNRKKLEEVKGVAQTTDEYVHGYNIKHINILLK